MSDSDPARTAHSPLETDTPASNAVTDLRHEFESLAAKYPELYHSFVFIGDRELYDPHTVGAPEAAIELARSLCPFPGKCQVIAAGPQLGSVHFSIYLAEETVDPGLAKGALVDFKTISALASRQITLKPSTKWPFGTKWGRNVLLPNSRIVGVVPTDPIIPVNPYYRSTFREVAGSSLKHSHPGNVLLIDPNVGNELPWLDHLFETVESRDRGDASGYWGRSLSCGVFRASLLSLGALGTTETQRLPPPMPARLAISVEPPKATLDGHTWTLRSNQALMLHLLIEAAGDYVSLESHSIKAAREKETLPRPLLELIEAKDGSGHRIPISTLVELRLLAVGRHQ